MPKPPIPEAVRQRVAELHGRKYSRNAIATELGIAPSSVTKIAGELGLTFDRSATRVATAAAQVDNAGRRAALSSRLLDEASKALDEMNGEFLVFSFGGKDNTWNERTLDGPPTGDKRNLMSVASTAIQRHLDIENRDSGAADGAVSLITDLFNGIKIAAESARGELPAADDA